MEEKNGEKILYANILKIVASIAVVLLHVSAIDWYMIDATSKEWNIINIYDSIVRWGVPIFVMVTGMLLLPEEKEIKISKIFKKYIKRVMIMLVIWSAFYAILDRVLLTPDISTKYFIMSFINGHYHLWYLYMLIGLYLATPIIKLITKPENKKIIEYFLIIWFISECCLNMIIKLPIFSNLDIIYANFHIDFFLGFVGYYILGYYLSKYDIKKHTRYILYVLGILSVIFIILGTRYLKITDYKLPTVFYNALSAPVCLNSMAVFCMVKQIFSKKRFAEKTQVIINKWTKLSLGVYLIHPMYIVIMSKLNISLLQWPVILSIPIATIIIYILSAIPSYILSRIPKIGKFIV